MGGVVVVYQKAFTYFALVFKPNARERPRNDHRECKYTEELQDIYFDKSVGTF